MTSLETPGSEWRRQRWLDAGSPIADLHRLQYEGADSVRWILEAVLRKLPPEVAWFAIEAVDWIEVGHDAWAWAHHQPAPRSLPGDVGHRIVINGARSDGFPGTDERLFGVIAHEISHRWRKMVESKIPPTLPLAFVDVLAVKILVESPALTDDEQWLARAEFIGPRVAEELRADEQARAWGFAWPGHDPDELRRRFAAQYDGACRMARLAAEAADPPRGGSAELSAAPDDEGATHDHSCHDAAHYED